MYESINKCITLQITNCTNLNKEDKKETLTYKDNNISKKISYNLHKYPESITYKYYKKLIKKK